MKVPLSIRYTNDRENGFTLLELMLAMAIFGLLMLYISQFMRSEIHLFGAASQQNDLEQKTRQAMMQILDEIRLHPGKYYYAGDQQGKDSGVYALPPGSNTPVCLIDLNPSDLNNLPAGTEIYLDQTDSLNGKLKFRDTANGNATYLIADWIASLNLSLVPGDNRLLKIDLRVKDPQENSLSYELVSWARLY